MEKNVKSIFAEDYPETEEVLVGFQLKKDDNILNIDSNEQNYNK